MTNETNQKPFFQNLNEIYQEREKIFQQREQDYLKQKSALNNLLDTIKKEKSELEKDALEQKKKQEELKQEEQNQQTWYQQLCEERRKLEQERKNLEQEKHDFQSEKDSAKVQYQVQIEKAKNDEILAKQKKEEYEHKLDMLGLVLDADGKPGEESTKFFESLLGGTENVNAEEVQALEEENNAYQKQIQQLEERNENLEDNNDELRETNEQLRDENKQLSEKVQKAEEEKNRLLALVSSISQKNEEPEKQVQEEETVPNFGTEEGYVPTFGRKQKTEEQETQDDVFEELTASVLQKYISKNEAKYISSEIKHSEEGEQLHANINNLDYVFLFSQPAAFDVSVPRKKSRALAKLLTVLNTQHPGVKFYYDEHDNRVYASGYFSNTMTPENLMNKVHEVSDCFRQK